MAIFKKSEKAAGELDKSNLPRHIAIILDGNGRWAKSKGLPRTAGHAAGAENFRTIANYFDAYSGGLPEDGSGATMADPNLRDLFARRMAGLGKSPNSFGLVMTEAAYSPDGAAWVDQLIPYLDANRKIVDAALNAIPGLASMTMEATYLAWVDFSGTGMEPAEFTARVEKGSKIAANHGDTFGKGGENFLRFNIAAPRSQVAEAVARLQKAFSDLQ